VLVGDKIPLSLVLWDGNNSMFIKAIIRDGKHELQGSPVFIPYNNLEKQYFYKSADLVVPDGAKIITIEYIVYTDLELTNESPLYQRSQDIYEVLQAPSQSEINDKLDNIINIVTSHGLNDILVGSVSTDTLVGVVLDEELEGVMFNDDCIIGIAYDDKLVGFGFDDTINGSIGEIP
jgi:hypothetical protein